MKFVDLIKPSAIKVINTASSKKRLLHDVADLAMAAYGIDADTAVEALMERESLGPTGVGHGVATASPATSAEAMEPPPAPTSAMSMVGTCTA